MSEMTSVNLAIRSLADGFSLKGGTVARKLQVTGSDVSLVGPQTTTVNLPNYSSTTLVAYDDYPAKGALLSASAANTVSSLSVGTDGYVLTADSTQLTGLAWKSNNPISTITTSQTAAANYTYVIDSTAPALVNLALPTTSAVGSYIKVHNMSSNLWTITQSAGQRIYFLNSATTSGAGGSLQSNSQYDSIHIVCVVADTTWLVVASSGNFTLS